MHSIADDACACARLQDIKLSAAYSVNPDIPTFHTVGGKTYIVNHFEFGEVIWT